MEDKSRLVPSSFSYFAFSGIHAATVGKVATQLIPIYRKRILPAELAFYWSQRVVMLIKILHDRVQNLLVFQKADIQRPPLFWIRCYVVQKWRVVVSDMVFTITQVAATGLCTRAPVGSDEMSLVYIPPWRG